MQEKPRNIFEAINLNIVELSEDLVKISAKVDEIHAALYPPQNPTEQENE